MTIQTLDNKFAVAQWIVDPVIGLGTHTTIASALASASSGDTIFIKPGIYTENITLVAGVNLSAFVCDCDTPNVTIVGTCSFSSAGTVSLSGLRLQTNGAFCLSITGSAASRIFLTDCFIDATDNTAIELSSSSASSLLFLQECYGDIATTGIAYFSGSSAGILRVHGGYFQNSGMSSTPSTFSSGGAFLFSTAFENGFASSGTAQFVGQQISINGAFSNMVALAQSSSVAAAVFHSTLTGGTASAATVGIGSQFQADFLNVQSSNANSLDGLGTIRYGLITYTAGSGNNNITTQTPFLTQPQSASWILISDQTAANSSSIVFTSAISPAFRNYAIILSSVVPVTNAVFLRLRVSTNGGATYLAASYSSTALMNSGAGVASSTSTTELLLTRSATQLLNNTADNGLSGVIYLHDLTVGVAPKISGEVNYLETSGGVLTVVNPSGRGPAALTVDALQFTMSSGNISTGNFKLYGIA